MAGTLVAIGPPAAGTLHPMRGVGAQFNTNIFTKQGEDPDLTIPQRAALLAAIKPLQLGHSRIFVRPRARAAGVQRKALLATVKLADAAGANVNLTWWMGPFPHDPQPGHAQKRKKLMDDFAGIVKEAQASNLSCVTHLTVMNEVNSHDIAKLLKPRKSMDLYRALYEDLHDSLQSFPSRPLLIGGDLVKDGPGTILVDGVKRKYGPSNQNDWLDFMRGNMDVLDGYSIHIYWTPEEFPTKLEDRLKDLARQGIDQPLFVTEYGVRRQDPDQRKTPRPGTFEGTPAGLSTPNGTKMEQSPRAAFMHAWFNALAPQYGCVGLVKWVLYKTSKRGEFGDWGMIGPVRGPHGPFHAWPTSDVTRIFNELIGPGWVADGFGKAAGGRILASRFKDPAGGGQSVVVLNNSAQPQPVQVKGVTKNTRFAVVEWNHNGDGKRHKLDAPILSGGSDTVGANVPAHGLVAFTTLPLT